MNEKFDLVVLNYSTGRVTVYRNLEIELDSEVVENFLIEKGHDTGNCYWMTGVEIQFDWE
jgi:hypothetical protein